jgi:hypothetical protein
MSSRSQMTQRRAFNTCSAHYYSFIFVFAILLSSVTNCYSQAHTQEAVGVLKQNADVICKAGELFNVSPRIVASVIFVEHALNVTWVDRDVDPLLAQYDINVSLGLGQVKINTAKWIEELLHDSTSRYFLGEKYSLLLPLSTSREDLVKRLLIPSCNAKYIAAVIAMIQHRWKEAEVDIRNEVDILATLYSAGVVNDDGFEKRPPHENPKSNRFGKIAEEFYESEIEGVEFPKKRF